jgi:EAL domain-containing protein (putative c-di-GMP-specific phosphodiesterase class I)
LDGHEVFASASIGIATSAGYDNPHAVLRDADTAMHRAKALGGGRCELFDSEMRDRAVARLQLETDLKRAIERHEFCLHYQPIVSFDTGAITGFEALVRWRHPERGMVGPAEFISAAEETGAIVAIGRWVLREACHQMMLWHSEPHNRLLTISVNVSGKQFSEPEFVDDVAEILRATGLNASRLKLELTESTVMDRTDRVIVTLNRLKGLGVQLAIDDFGTGYSSLSYLRQFPIQSLKIDRSFVSGIGPAGEGSEVIRAIMDLAHNLGLDVTVEGIENKSQLEQLRKLGCEHGQGYFFSEPVDRDAARTLIAGTRETTVKKA